MIPSMSPIQHEVRLPEKTLQELAAQPIPESVPKDRDPVKAPVKKRVYTLGNPPPHLRAIPLSLLEKAYDWAQGDWYLIEPIPGGVMTHNNRSMADKFRKSH